MRVEFSLDTFVWTEFPLDTFFDRHSPHTAAPRNSVTSDSHGAGSARLMTLIPKNHDSPDDRSSWRLAEASKTRV